MRKTGWHEVIRIASPELLLTSSQRKSPYETADGKPLAVGYYLAVWPALASRQSQSYSRALCYFGPFSTRAQAKMLQTSALALDLIPALPLDREPGDSKDYRQSSSSPFSLARATLLPLRQESFS